MEHKFESLQTTRYTGVLKIYINFQRKKNFKKTLPNL